MPSSYSDFTSAIRNGLKPRIFVDLNEDGVAEEYTSNLVSCSIYSDQGDKLCGLYDSEFEAVLMVNNPSINWIKSGLAIEARIQVTNDNFATNHEEKIFVGITEQQTTLPVFEFKITARTKLNNYLSGRPPRQIFLNTDLYTIIDTLMTQAGVPSGEKSIPTSGITVNYVVDQSRPYSFFINELLEANLAWGGFERDGVFRIRQALKLDLAGTPVTTNATYTNSRIEKYKQRDLYSPIYNNVIDIQGYLTTVLSDTFLYYNSQLSGYEIAAGQKLYAVVEMPNIRVATFNDFEAGYPGVLAQLFRTGGIRKSYFACYTADDGSGVIDLVSPSLDSVSVVTEDNVDKLFIVIKNNGSSTIYLKGLFLRGSGLRLNPSLKYKEKNTADRSQNDKTLKINNLAIQDDIVMNNIGTRIRINTWAEFNTYVFDCPAEPKLDFTQSIQFQDRSGTTYNGNVLSVDTGIDQDNGYSSTVVVQVIPDSETPFAWDDANIGWDDSDYAWR